MALPTSAGRWFVRLVLATAAVVAVGYLAYGLWGTAQLDRAEDEARDVVATLARERAGVQEPIVATRAEFGEPVRSYSQVVCEMTSLDAGWMVTAYAQRCALEAVDVH